MQQLANGELRTQVVKWNVECCKIHLAMKEIIHAKAQKLIANDLYEKMLSTMCSKLCALPVCTMAWIINYRKTMPASKIGMYEKLSYKSFNDISELHNYWVSKSKIGPRGTTFP